MVELPRTLVEAPDLVGDLWSVPAYLRRCAPWLTSDEVKKLQRKMIGDLTDGGITFAFDHDAEQRFGAGIPHQHTAAPVQGHFG